MQVKKNPTFYPATPCFMLRKVKEKHTQTETWKPRPIQYTQVKKTVKKTHRRSEKVRHARRDIKRGERFVPATFEKRESSISFSNGTPH